MTATRGPSRDGLSRREAIAAGFALPFALALPVGAGASPAQPEIRPRSAWATSHPVRGKLQPEKDVRFLLVHHTLTPNTDRPDTVAGRIRGIYAFHTRDRGWADVAYNFFVDPFGVIWEGRQGSIAGPVQPDATGGSQGYSQLGCFIGDFTSTLPTPAAMDAMVALLAWLAARSSLPLQGEVSFTSRGSSRWPKGVTVTTPRIAGHRDMSRTDCPGDALYPRVASELLPRAAALLGGPGASTDPTPAQPGTPDPEPSPTPTSTPAATPTTSPASVGPAAPAPVAPPPGVVGGVAAGVAAAGVATYLVARKVGRGSAQQGERSERNAAEHEGGGEGDHEADQRR